MAKELVFIAFDLGAESGRGVAGLFDGDRLRLEEIHRFPNGPVEVMGSLFWDVLRLFEEIKEALRISARRFGEVESIGLDTWGVDFGLLGRGDVLLANPYHYRDRRTDGMMEEAFRRVPREEIFERTGIQFMQLNTLYQLLAMSVENSPILEMAETLLMMPDLFNFWLTGVKVSEFSIATTTQFYNPKARSWATDLLERMGLPARILPEIVPSGTILGELLPYIRDDVGLKSTRVIAPTCHDTASAVAAVPARGENWLYISSGTWSLMGVEIREPIINEKSLQMNFTNEGGYGGTIRFLKNIMGLWLVQESRRTWARAGEDHSYPELTRMAAEAQPFKAFVDPDHRAFLPPGDMPARIRGFCLKTSQPAPQTKGEIVRCSLESLALKYRWTMECLEEVLGERFEVIHVVGGGSRNELLCQFTADATGKRVLAGPSEATAIGNIMVQALAQGHVTSHQEAREVVRRSFELREHEPGDKASWDEAYDRFLKVIEMEVDLEP
ncbi:TPA: rhamnulokinase [Candidatus Poribacteria bacterium]|nr:rhamnulokinase [Candidatus Poribacteria bacterium]